MYKFIKVEASDGITCITLNRPEVMNAVNATMHHELQSAFDAFARDDSQRLGVITGTGTQAFCAGSDLKAIAGGETSEYPCSGYAGLIERFDLSKPLIAAVNGVCLGGGFEIALSCDIIVASENASFGLPEPRVGAVALGGGIHRLVRQIGQKQAMAMLLACRRLSAADAFDVGLVNEVAEAGSLGKVVKQWCADILAGAPYSIQATKEAAMRGLDENSLASAINSQTSYPQFVKWQNAADTREGPKAFAEKRKPNWQGK